MDHNGETLYKGWREGKNNLFRIDLTKNGTKRIVPDTDPVIHNPSSGIVMNMTWSMNSVYEYENKSQLIKYYHARIGSCPKKTLAASARARYLKGCPGLTQEVMNKFISIEDYTEMGHL